MQRSHSHSLARRPPAPTPGAINTCAQVGARQLSTRCRRSIANSDTQRADATVRRRIEVRSAVGAPPSMALVPGQASRSVRLPEQQRQRPARRKRQFFRDARRLRSGTARSPSQFRQAASAKRPPIPQLFRLSGVTIMAPRAAPHNAQSLRHPPTIGTTTRKRRHRTAQ